MIAVPVIIEVNYILNLWLGDNVPEYTVIFTILVIINMLISNFNAPLTLIIHATGKMRTYQLTTSIILTSILPISWVVLSYGAEPTIVYLIDILIVLINQIVCIFVVRNVFAFSLKQYCVKVLLPSLFVFIALPIIPFSFSLLIDASFIRLCCVCLLSIVSAVIFIYLLGLNNSEREIVKSYLKRLICKIKKSHV